MKLGKAFILQFISILSLCCLIGSCHSDEEMIADGEIILTLPIQSPILEQEPPKRVKTDSNAKIQKLEKTIKQLNNQIISLSSANIKEQQRLIEKVDSLSQKVNKLEEVVDFTEEKLKILEVSLKETEGFLERSEMTVVKLKVQVNENKSPVAQFTKKKKSNLNKLTEKDPNLIFLDHFENNRKGWLLGETENRSINISDGVYRFKYKKESGTWMTWNDRINQRKDITNYNIEVIIRKISGNNNQGFGIIWNLINNKNFLSIKINGQGQYRVEKVDDGIKSVLVPWIYNSILNSGNNDNLIEIKQLEKGVEIYINEKKVKSIDLIPSEGKKVGFIIDGNIEIESELFSIRKAF